MFTMQQDVCNYIKSIDGDVAKTIIEAASRYAKKTDDDNIMKYNYSTEDEFALITEEFVSNAAVLKSHEIDWCGCVLAVLNDNYHKFILNNVYGVRLVYNGLTFVYIQNDDQTQIGKKYELIVNYNELKSIISEINNKKNPVASDSKKYIILGLFTLIALGSYKFIKS